MDKRFKLDFIGIGAMKSGTTWLANCLRAHPEICLSEPKGVRYFNLHQNYFTQNTPSFNSNHTKPLSWYLNHFKHCPANEIKGECTSHYFYDERAPSRIKSSFPHIKLILCLRNPIDRAYSHYWMHRSASQLDIPFEDAIIMEKMYVDMGFYSKQLKRYHKCFTRDQILILLFDDIVNHPEEEITKVLQFLNVSTHIKADVLKNSYANPAKQFKVKAIENILYSTSRLLIDLKLSYVIHMFRKIGIYHLITKLNTAPFKYPVMNNNTREYLGNMFKDEVKELGTLVNRDLSHWQ